MSALKKIYGSRLACQEEDYSESCPARMQYLFGASSFCSRNEGDVSADRRAFAWLRFDRQFAPDQIEALLHADESHPPPFYGLERVKPDSRIIHSQADLNLCATERYIKALRAAMFDRILQGFLQNTEYTEGDLLR